MLSPFWTDAVIRCLFAFSSLGPWALVLMGLSSQAAGVLMLARAHRAAHEALTSQPMRVALPAAADAESLGFFVPVSGSEIPTDPHLLPGALRAYRGGRHEGIDFSCPPGTPVKAAAAGYVLSIEDEPNLPKRRRDELLEYCRQRGETPGEVLEVLHGKRVVLCHGTLGGELTTTGYSHLEKVEASLRPGSEVDAGQVLGWAGNSGTGHAYERGTWAELHFELRRNGVPVGMGLPPQKIVALYRDYLRREAP